MGVSTKGKRSMKAKAVKGLFEKGHVDKAVVKKATSMSMDTWKKLQVGMDAQWPLPDYMHGKKGGMNFKPETFAFVTRWTANTRIKYRPHAKKPGSKSHLRYEKYMKAKTVGEAYKLKVYPADWCWDFERGFLRVMGGHIRDEPLDITKEGGKATDVDKAIHTWYKRELARKIGVPVSELSVHQGSGESLAMRGGRLLAQKEAKEILEAAEKEGRPVTDEEMRRTLERWPFARNPFRQNVIPDGQDWVFSDTLGLLRDRSGDLHLSPPTRRYPQVAELMVRWLLDRLPKEAKDFKFTSMNVNCNYAAKMHRDAGNFGPSFIRAFGDYSGGELEYWPGDDKALDLKATAKKPRECFDLQKNLVLFNGNSAHAVKDFKGTRFSIVWFSLGCHAEATKEDRAKLEALGMPLPAAAEDPHKLLMKPVGYAKGTQQKKPTFRSWKNTELKPRGPTKKEAVKAAKRRLKREDARAFYGWQQIKDRVISKMQQKKATQKAGK